jgi:flagella basal body P-ring formation protein FlgA
LPFYAVVSWPTEPQGRTTITSNTFIAASKPNAAISMRAGAHAILVMDDGRAHIQIAVISLENGIVGHNIRVATPDHKQTYVAEVANEILLRKSF